MPSLKELRNRISTVKATQKITRAMQMVAAAKLRRAQIAAEAARPYAERMDSVMANLSGAMMSQEDASPLMVGTGKDDTHLLLVATADRGLCGAFNSSIVRMARKQAESLIAQGKDVKIITVGKKGYELLKGMYQSRILRQFDLQASKTVNFEMAAEVSRTLLELFEAGEFDKVWLFYGKFNSVISQEPTKQQIIPAALPESDTDNSSVDLGGSAYDYEPDEQEILEDLLPRNLTVQIFRALLENAASEQGARMSAMDNATRNAGEMIDDLTLFYNRSRQAQITKELIEIISGAEAL